MRNGWKIKIQKFIVRARPKEEGIWNLGPVEIVAKFEDHLYLQGLPLRVLPAEQNSTNQRIVNEVSGCIKMLGDEKIRQDFFSAPKVLSKRCSA